MQLNSLVSLTSRSKKRLGRGYGSGKGGHTSSRGQKGQKSRNSVAIWFEGGQLPMKKKIPFLRGKNRFKTIHTEKVAINLKDLNRFEANTEITPLVLAKAGVISVKEAANARVKILSNGEITKALSFKGCVVSQQAANKIKQAGGEIIAVSGDEPIK
jgi:large subunit ribosomal protein L15